MTPCLDNFISECGATFRMSSPPFSAPPCLKRDKYSGGQVSDIGSASLQLEDRGKRYDSVFIREISSQGRSQTPYRRARPVLAILELHSNAAKPF